MDFATNSVINVAPGHNQFSLNFGDQPLVPSVLMHSELISRQIKAVQTTVERILIPIKNISPLSSLLKSDRKSHVD